MKLKIIIEGDPGTGKSLVAKFLKGWFLAKKTSEMFVLNFREVQIIEGSEKDRHSIDESKDVVILTKAPHVEPRQTA